jgi:autotransporter translocation and assembly factor TamB
MRSVGKVRKIVGRICAIIGVLVLLVILVLGSVAGLVRTSFGGERIRRVVESQINRSISGTLHVRHLRVGRSEITLDGIELRDTEDGTVATIDRLYVRLSLAGLLRHQLLVPTVDVRGPHLFLSSNAAGLSNWSRALAPRRAPTPSSVRPATPPKASGWNVWLGSLQIRDGSLRMIRSGASTIVASAIQLTSDGSYADQRERNEKDEKSFRIHLQMEGDVQQPAREAVTIAVDADGTLTRSGLNCEATLALGVGRSRVRLALFTDSIALSQMPSDQRGRATLLVEDGAITPSDLGEILPTLRPKADLHVAGRADWDGRRSLVSAQLEAHARATKATVELSAETPPLAVVGLRVKAQHIDVSDWLVDGPRSDFGIDVRGQGKGSSLAAFLGSLEVRIPTGKMGGYSFGPVRLSIQGKTGHYTMAELVARLPGARLKGHGELSADQMALRLRVDADNLATAARAFAPARSAAARNLAGRGSLQIDARGELRAPSLRLSADFKNLRFQDDTVAAMQLRAFVPNIRQPLSAEVAVMIPDMQAGGRWLRGLTLQLRGVGSRLSAKLALDTPERVRAVAEGSWTSRHDSVVLDRLDVNLQRKAWSIARPAHVAWNGANIRVTDFELHATSDDEWLRLDTQVNHRRVLADVRLHGFQLDQLPPSLLPPRLGLVGELDAEVHAHGSWSAPYVQGVLAVHHGQVAGCALGEVTLSAKGQPGRPSTVTAQIRPPPDASEKRCAEEADVLLRTQLLPDKSWPRQWRTSPNHLEVHLRGIDLGFLARLAAKPDAYGGRVDVEATMDGALKARVVKADLRAFGIYAAGIPPTDGAATLTLSEHELSGRLAIDRRGAQLLVADFGANAPASLFQTSRISAASLRLHAEVGPVHFQHRSLSTVAAGNDSDMLRGTAKAAIDVDGTLADPHATLHADVSDLRLGNTSWGDAQADITYARGALDAKLSARDRNGSVLFLQSSMNLALGYPHFMRPIAWAKQSIAGKMDAHAVDLSPLSAISPRWHDVSGRLECHLAWSGTVTDPMPTGSVEIRNGTMTVTDVGRYKNIHLSLRGDRQHFSLDELKLASGEGSVTVAANATHRSSGVYDVNGTLSVDKFPVYSDGQAIASVSSEATAKAEISSARLNAWATLQSARIAMNDGKRKELAGTSRPKDVVVLREAQSVPKKARLREVVSGTPMTASQSNPSVILVSAPRNLWVNGKDAAVEIGLEPGFRIELSTPSRIYGGVVVKRGRIDVLGKRFDLKADSSLRFQGPADAPELDVTAQYVNEQEHVTVVATVKGSPKHLATTLTAPDQPNLTESQLYTLVLTGRLDFAQGPAGSASPASEAGSLLGGLMATELQRIVAKKLPLDVLTIAGGDTMGSAKVEAGKYVTSDVYVGYVGRLGADPMLLENRNAVHLEYMMGTHWSFEGEYGDAKAGSADMVWTKHY